MAELHEIALTLDALLAEANIPASKVTADGVPLEPLADGYYLCEVLDSTELTVSKSSGQPMVALKLRIVENGLKSVINDSGDTVLVEAEKSKGRFVNMYYVLKDKNAVDRMVCDMLKFELPDVPDQPILSKEYFTSTELLCDALECLKTSRIYVNAQTVSKATGETDVRFSLVKWSRAKALDLPM